MIANGVTTDLPADIAEDVLDILRQTGRAPEPYPWVERCVRKAAEIRATNLPHNHV